MSEALCSISGCDTPAFSRGWCRKHYARWWRNGDPSVVMPPSKPPTHPRPECSLPDCSRPHRGKGLCAMHYARVRRTGSTEPTVRQSLRGADHPLWKGDEASYNAIHKRVERLRGKAWEWCCAHCAVPAEDWAYNHEAVNELTSKWGPYSADPDDYIPLCRSCHRVFDLGVYA